MRLIGTLLVLLFALRLQPASGHSQVRPSCANTCIGSPVLAGSLWASTSTSPRDGVIWMSGLETLRRHRQRRNPRRRLARLLRLAGG